LLLAILAGCKAAGVSVVAGNSRRLQSSRAQNFSDASSLHDTVLCCYSRQMASILLETPETRRAAWLVKEPSMLPKSRDHTQNPTPLSDALTHNRSSDPQIVAQPEEDGITCQRC
jgi:hypothetical protein